MIHDSFIETIIDTIPEKARVLDLGCGDGDLLLKLQERKQTQSYGIDFKFDHILKCLSRGLSVFQGTIEEGLQDFTDNAFDVVILSLTLQQIKDPAYVLREMCRVGKRVIVVFPNFGFYQVRLRALLGKAPITTTLPYTWYNTPNIRVLSISDFRDLCKKNNFDIEGSRGLGFLGNISFLSNLFSSTSLFILKGPS